MSARLRHNDDAGAYAIMYAILVVVLIGMASLVVDIATLRADKRDDRSVADFSSLAGISDLGSGPYTPVRACKSVLANASEALGVTFPTGGCDTAFGADPTTTCPGTALFATSAAGDFTIHIKWPIAADDPAMTNPDGLQAGAPARSTVASFDGTNACARLAVDVQRIRTLGLSAALGYGHGSSIAGSVARLTPKITSGQTIAALNILDTTACQALYVSGQGRIIVNRATDLSKGTIAVESDGSGCTGNNNKFVIDLGSDASAQICASGPNQVPDAAGTCDGLGKIVQHALESQAFLKAYGGSTGAPTQNLRPTPEAEGGLQGWVPVTSKYGCATLPGCGATPTYIPSLFSAYNGSWPPTTVYAGQGTYAGNTYGGTFQTLNDGQAIPGGLGTFSCVQANQAAASYYVPPGNWLINCPDSNNQAGFQVAQRALFGGGQLVFRGGIKLLGAGCFTTNTPLASLPASASLLTCATTVNPTDIQATTSPAPTQEALVFVRGSQGFVTSANNTVILMPQTILVQANNGPLSLTGGSGTLLWTAPGAGVLNGAGKSALDLLCTSDVGTTTTCHDSHFAKVAYWNETASAALSLKGQGSLSLVGTYFAPRANFTFTGQSNYYATSAQFWVNTLTLAGQTGLGMTPDAALSFPRLDYGVTLIR